LVEAQFRWNVGDAVRERVATGAETPQKYIVAQRGYFDSHGAYELIDDATGEQVGGWYREDWLEPYDPTPIPYPPERD
jgi:hypothetical protein